MRQRHQWVGYVTVTAVALLVGAGAAWAASTVLRPAEDPLQAQSFTSVIASNGAVGAEISLNAVAAWTPVPVGDNRAAGVVTSITVTAGDEVSQGAVLYSVDLRPVVVAQGEVPAFRPIEEKTTGPDVAQLQQMLADLAFYGGAVDGEAGAGTVAAIKRWQRSVGVEQTGRVEAGDIIFVPDLPTRVALDATKVFRGATLAGGESVLNGLPAAPLFSIPATESQASMTPTGTRVEIAAPDGTIWEAFAGTQTRDAETQTVTVSLAGADGASICGDGCGQVPVTSEARLSSRIVTIEQVTGVVVPSAALITTSDGQTSVIDEDGRRLPVTVVASARGMTVVEGIDAGLNVRVPANETEPTK